MKSFQKLTTFAFHTFGNFTFLFFNFWLFNVFYFSSWTFLFQKKSKTQCFQHMWNILMSLRPIRLIDWLNQKYSFYTEVNKKNMDLKPQPLGVSNRSLGFLNASPFKLPTSTPVVQTLAWMEASAVLTHSASKSVNVSPDSQAPTVVSQPHVPTDHAWTELPASTSLPRVAVTTAHVRPTSTVETATTKSLLNRAALAMSTRLRVQRGATSVSAPSHTRTTRSQYQSTVHKPVACAMPSRLAKTHKPTVRSGPIWVCVQGLPKSIQTCVEDRVVPVPQALEFFHWTSWNELSISSQKQIN